MKKYNKLFIATSSFSELSNERLKKLKKKNILVKLNPLKKKLDKTNLLKYGSDADYIIAGTEKYDKEIISKLFKLNYLFRLGSGTDNVDINFLESKKIIFNKSKITPEISVAELIIAYILILLRKINTMDQKLKNNIWEKQMGNILNSKIVGIIGYGKIGKHLHKLIKAFGAKVLINDIKAIKNGVSLKYLLRKSDVVSVNINSNKTKKF